MAYVTRDGSNNINGAFSKLQPGIATERVAESVQELIDFRNRPQLVAIGGLPTFTDATRPAATDGVGMIFNSTSGVPEYSDGTNWKNFSDNAIT